MGWKIKFQIVKIPEMVSCDYCGKSFSIPCFDQFTLFEMFCSWKCRRKRTYNNIAYLDEKFLVSLFKKHFPKKKIPVQKEFIVFALVDYYTKFKLSTIKLLAHGSAQKSRLNQTDPSMDQFDGSSPPYIRGDPLIHDPKLTDWLERGFDPSKKEKEVIVT